MTEPLGEIDHGIGQRASDVRMLVMFAVVNLHRSADGKILTSKMNMFILKHKWRPLGT